MNKKKFKTLAEFKKLIKVGTQIGTIMHRYFVPGKGFIEKMIENREVVRVQTNAFAASFETTNGERKESWLHWPKATQVEISEEQKLKVYEWNERTGQKELILTYWIYEDRLLDMVALTKKVGKNPKGTKGVVVHIKNDNYIVEVVKGEKESDILTVNKNDLIKLEK